jgi:protein phosphatase
VLVLCSDGLSSMVTDDEIQATLAATLPDEDAACRALVRAAIAHGGKDNVTVVVASIV